MASARAGRWRRWRAGAVFWALSFGRWRRRRKADRMLLCGAAAAGGWCSGGARVTLPRQRRPQLMEYRVLLLVWRCVRLRLTGPVPLERCPSVHLQALRFCRRSSENLRLPASERAALGERAALWHQQFAGHLGVYIRWRRPPDSSASANSLVRGDCLSAPPRHRGPIAAGRRRLSYLPAAAAAGA